MNTGTGGYVPNLQTLADIAEDRSIRTFELWQSWARRHTLAETEQRLRGEGVTRGKSRSRLSSVVLGVATIEAAIGVALLLWSMR